MKQQSCFSAAERFNIIVGFALPVGFIHFFILPVLNLKCYKLKKALPKKRFFLAGVARFELTNAAVKVLCLTA